MHLLYVNVRKINIFCELEPQHKLEYNIVLLINAINLKPWYPAMT